MRELPKARESIIKNHQREQQPELTQSQESSHSHKPTMKNILICGTPGRTLRHYCFRYTLSPWQNTTSVQFLFKNVEHWKELCLNNSTVSRTKLKTIYRNTKYSATTIKLMTSGIEQKVAMHSKKENTSIMRTKFQSKLTQNWHNY